MKVFYCQHCNVTFEDLGKVYEYMDFTFGPCKSLRANCPKCNNESAEHIKAKPGKGSGFEPSCNDFGQGGACGNGCCCAGM